MFSNSVLLHSACVVACALTRGWLTPFPLGHSNVGRIGRMLSAHAHRPWQVGFLAHALSPVLASPCATSTVQVTEEHSTVHQSTKGTAVLDLCCLFCADTAQGREYCLCGPNSCANLAHGPCHHGKKPAAYHLLPLSLARRGPGCLSCQSVLGLTGTSRAR